MSGDTVGTSRRNNRPLYMTRTIDSLGFWNTSLLIGAFCASIFSGWWTYLGLFLYLVGLVLFGVATAQAAQMLCKPPRYGKHIWLRFGLTCPVVLVCLMVTLTTIRRYNVATVYLDLVVVVVFILAGSYIHRVYNQRSP